MEKIIIWLSVERYRASAFWSEFFNRIKLGFQNPLVKIFLASIWHTLILLLIGTVAILVLSFIFPPLLMAFYLLMYPMNVIVFFILLLLVIWLRPFVNKIFDTATSIVLALINASKR